jgi:hypothetical protein
MYRRESLDAYRIDAPASWGAEAFQRGDYLAGYIEDRWIKEKEDPATGKRERTTRYGKGKRCKGAGVPGVRDRSFDTWEDAKAWLRRAATDEELGEFVGPRRGSITLTEYIALHWAPGRRGALKTQENQERRARLHITPHLGELPIKNTTAAELRAHISTLEESVFSADYRRGILSELSSILEAAVDDKRLARTPMRAKSVRWPKSPKEPRGAWPLERALLVRDVINPRHREELKRHVASFPPVEVELPGERPEALFRRVPRARGVGSGRQRGRTVSMCCDTPTPGPRRSRRTVGGAGRPPILPRFSPGSIWGP